LPHRESFHHRCEAFQSAQLYGTPRSVFPAFLGLRCATGSAYHASLV
jgi:hypothetical protein